MALAQKQWMMIGGAVVAVLLLSLAPRAPKDSAETEMASGRVSEDPNSGSTPHAEDASHDHAAAEPVSKDPQVNAIIAKMNAAMASGQPPMAAILELKKLADEHPENVEAQYHMGLFSWQSGQYDKSMERFRKVIALDPKGYPDAYAFMGQAYGTLDSLDKAIAALETYKTLVTDTALLNGADRFLADLRTKKNT